MAGPPRKRLDAGLHGYSFMLVSTPRRGSGGGQETDDGRLKRRRQEREMGDARVPRPPLRGATATPHGLIPHCAGHFPGGRSQSASRLPFDP